MSRLGGKIKALFAQMLMTCDGQGLIKREMFAINGVKLAAHKDCPQNRCILEALPDRLRYYAPRNTMAA